MATTDSEKQQTTSKRVRLNLTTSSAVISHPWLDGGFLALPWALIKSKEFSKVEIEVISYIRARQAGAEWIGNFCGMRVVAKLLRRNRTSVRKAIDKLIRLGLLKKVIETAPGQKPVYDARPLDDFVTRRVESRREATSENDDHVGPKSNHLVGSKNDHHRALKATTLSVKPGLESNHSKNK